MGGPHRLEQVARFPWNEWPSSRGIRRLHTLVADASGPRLGRWVDRTFSLWGGGLIVLNRRIKLGRLNRIVAARGHRGTMWLKEGYSGYD
jgi:hypothetical protein